VLTGVAICWSYDLLPRWLLAVLVAREALMLAVGQAWVRRGLALRINWPGRIALPPTLFGLWLALLGVRAIRRGLRLRRVPRWRSSRPGLYMRDGIRQLRVSRLSLTLGLTPLYSPQSSAPHGKTPMDDTFPISAPSRTKSSRN